MEFLIKGAFYLVVAANVYSPPCTDLVDEQSVKACKAYWKAADTQGSGKRKRVDLKSFPDCGDRTGWRCLFP